MKPQKLDRSFFRRDVLDVAPELIGKIVVRKFDNGEIRRYRITETEAYRGEEDRACHASKGRTARTEVMYHEGGKVYVYLIYGMYWMLNLVTSEADHPCAVLIRGIEGFEGPGKVGRELRLDKSFYGEDISTSERLWVETDDRDLPYSVSCRVGVDYAAEWAKKPWRFVAKSDV
ncbi:MAG TPA: DNA-3-methyladenine glycosylase [Prolixibacteraceae bacterium]|nr:DNA-3-methyladenine glycosylase [Prolixibacteraceae bacterium]HPS11809.1 DNA-3-methyladenine glycosylase [Prolixibacteraceae bacterium]